MGKDFTDNVDLTQAPRPFVNLAAAKIARFFLKDKRKALDPDDDN
jgi:hypothetical protein